MSEIKNLTQLAVDFREERNWKQFHTVKDMLLSLSIEVAELGEHFQWKQEEEIPSYLEQHRGEVADELADCLYWLLLLSHEFSIDLATALPAKVAKNAKKYPVSKSFGSKEKYTALLAAKDQK